MSYIQLIEKAELPTSLWLTFWDIIDQSQISLEIAAPTAVYEVGSVFSLDRDAKFERLALKPVRDAAEVMSLDLLIPLPTGQPPRGRTVEQRSVSIRETTGGTARTHEGLLSLLY